MLDLGMSYTPMSNYLLDVVQVFVLLLSRMNCLILEGTSRDQEEVAPQDSFY